MWIKKLGGQDAYTPKNLYIYCFKKKVSMLPFLQSMPSQARFRDISWINEVQSVYKNMGKVTA